MLPSICILLLLELKLLAKVKEKLGNGTGDSCLDVYE